MNTQQLQCFIAVADKLSFSKAAQSLYFSVPTVTHHIRQLEAELKTKLFIRNKRVVKLTEAGMIFYPYARDMLTAEDMAIKSMKSGTEHGHLRLGLTAGAEAYMLSPALSNFNKRYPLVDPFLTLDTYDRLIALLESGHIEMMMASIHMHKSTAFEFEELARVKTYAVMREEHELSERQEMSFSELEEERLILPHQKLIPTESDNPIRDMVNVHRLHHRDYVVENDPTILSLVMSGYGIGVMPGYRIPENYRSLGLSIVSIKENIDFPYGVMYKRESKNELMVFFINEVRGYLERLGMSLERED